MAQLGQHYDTISLQRFDNLIEHAANCEPNGLANQKGIFPLTPFSTTDRAQSTAADSDSGLDLDSIALTLEKSAIRLFM